MAFPPHAVALLLSAGLAAAIAAVTWGRRDRPGGTPFALLMLALAEWSLMSALEKAVPSLAGKVLCSKFEYLGISSVPVLWLLFALGYTQQGVLTPTMRALSWMMPLITIGLAATNESHGLVWSSVTLPPGSAFAVYGHGTWFWLFAAYTYGLLVGGMVLLARAVLRFRHVYRRQVLTVFVGLAVPWISNAIYLAGGSPFTGLDLTPFAFTLTGLVCAWGLFRFQLFDLVPVARDAVIESMSDGVIVLDARDRIVDINPAAERMLAIRGAASIGELITAVLPEWPAPALGADAQAETQTEVHLEGGPIQHIDVRSAPLSAGHGQTTGRLLLLRDITERKLLDEMRADLTHALVHDLRNPLAGISGSLEFLVDEAPSTVQREMLQIARTNAERMLGLIDSILDVNRLERGRLPLERREARIAALVAEVVQLQQPLANERRVHLVSDIPEDLPSVFVDPRLTTRVLHNLIDNALKFTPAGGTVRVSARPVDGRLAVAVSDSGPGIPEALRGRVFQKFAAGRGPGHGTGLGLAFCRLAVEAHGGHIWLDTSDASGTTILFTLPTAD